jgi:hypothetical protein
MNKTEFFEEYGHRLVQVNEDDTESGDYQLFSPEESDLAAFFQKTGYLVASVFEDEDGTERVELDNDSGISFHKIGYPILTP